MKAPLIFCNQVTPMVLKFSEAKLKTIFYKRLRSIF